MSDAALDRQIVRRLAAGMPLTPRPYDTVAHAIGVAPELVRARVAAMLGDGRIRRIGVVPNHYALGWRANGMTVWDNSAAPIGVPISASRVGVRIALGGGSSTTCGGRFVACYDLGSSDGLVHVRGWSSSGSGAQPNPPIARDVRLFAGSCPDAYFSAATSSCSIGVSAVVDFGTNDPVGALGASLTAVIGGIYTSSQQNVSNRTPGLGDLPLLGWLFKRERVTDESRELLIFITPRIIRG